MLNLLWDSVSYHDTSLVNGSTRRQIENNDEIVEQTRGKLLEM